MSTIAPVPGSVPAPTPAPAPAPASAATPDTQRLWQIDALRGLMLVLMTLTHLPTRFSSPTGQPFGFVSAAEGFVLLSGFMAGMVYTARERKHGPESMRSAFVKRVIKVYLCQAALLLFLFTVIAGVGVMSNQEAVTNMVSFFFERPLSAFLGGLLLVYNPPLLDILPMYVVFLLLSPLLLVHGLQRGWIVIMAVSVGLWLGAQFGFTAVVFDAVVALTRLPVPYEHTGSFDILAWQFLWVMGLWLGSTRAATPNPQPLRFPPWLVGTALAYAVVCLLWRHVIGQTPFPGEPGLNLMFDKWKVGPLRLINVFALMVLVVHYAPWLARTLPRMRWLETMGVASLPVFCAHLVLALVMLAVIGEIDPQRPWLLDAALLAACFVALYAVALVSREVDRKAQSTKKKLSDRRQARLSANAARSPTSTMRSPPG
jgi:hypothetical protein